MAATPNALSLAGPETKTSIHLVRASAFLGVHPRKQHLMVTVKAGNAIESPRIAEAEQMSPKGHS